MIPKVSIIIPVYNVEKYLRECLDSIISQSLLDWECILVDDGSKDNSPTICDEYVSRDNRFRVIHKENGGVASARNVGIDKASGEYVIHCDPDDWVDADFLEALYTEAKKSNSDIVSSDFIFEYTDKKKVRLCSSSYNDTKLILISTENHQCFLWNHLVSREIIAKYTLRCPEGLRISEDFALLFKCMYYAKTISHASTFYHYRKERDGALTNSRFEGVYYSDRIKACNILDEFLKSNGDKTQYGLLFVEKQKLKDYLLTTNDYKKWKELFPDVAKWNFKKSDANIVYRLFYLLGGTVSYRFIELYTKLSGLISSRNKQ